MLKRHGRRYRVNALNRDSRVTVKTAGMMDGHAMVRGAVTKAAHRAKSPVMASRVHRPRSLPAITVVRRATDATSVSITIGHRANDPSLATAATSHRVLAHGMTARQATTRKGSGAANRDVIPGKVAAVPMDSAPTDNRTAARKGITVVRRVTGATTRARSTTVRGHNGITARQMLLLYRRHPYGASAHCLHRINGSSQC